MIHDQLNEKEWLVHIASCVVVLAHTIITVKAIFENRKKIDKNIAS